MRKICIVLILGLAGFSVGCNSADDELQAIVTPAAADLSLELFESNRVTFTTTAICNTIPPPLEVEVQVIRLEALVQWLASSTCVGGLTPRQCAAGNLNAGAACTANADCDLTVAGDGLGTCAARPCRFDSDCEPNPDPNGKDDTCGAVSARLVFGSLVIDPRNQVEKGFIMFDNGQKLVPLNDATGNPTGFLVNTGDDVGRDLTYSRKFALVTTTALGLEECIAQELMVSTITTQGRKNFPMTFRVDAIDAVTGAARLSTVETAGTIDAEPTCCKVDDPANPGVFREFCHPLEPVCS